jgi:hypothetical protein
MEFSAEALQYMSSHTVLSFRPLVREKLLNVFIFSLGISEGIRFAPRG